MWYLTSLAVTSWFGAVPREDEELTAELIADAIASIRF
jgi:hypothetical protein